MRSVNRLWIARVSGLIAFIACWHAAGIALGDYWLPGPMPVILRAWDELRQGGLLRDVHATAQLMLIGTLLGALAGVALACILRLWPRLDRMVQPFVVAIMSVPKLGLVPLLVLWFGTGWAPKLLLVMLTVLFIVFALTYSGLVTIDQRLMMTARIFGAGPLELTRSIVLPTLWPFVLTGLEVALPWALSAALVAEFLSAKVGVGYAIDQSRQVRDSVGVFYGIALATTTVLACNTALSLVRHITLKTLKEQ